MMVLDFVAEMINIKQALNTGVNVECNIRYLKTTSPCSVSVHI
jgi:hypothetical protein